MSTLVEFRAAKMLGKTLVEFRGLPRAEQIAWRVYSVRDYYEQHPERMPK